MSINPWEAPKRESIEKHQIIFRKILECYETTSNKERFTDDIKSLSETLSSKVYNDQQQKRHLELIKKITE